MPSVDMIFGRVGMGYVGAWDLGAVEIIVDRLRRRSGELHGELVVSSAASAAGRGKLHRASFNLSSTVSRERLAKALRERSRSDDATPWLDHLEEFCAAVLEAERRGAPIVEVGRLGAAPAEGYLVDVLLPEAKTTIVFAAGGTGKSYLAILVSVGVSLGERVLGWSVRRGRVLYLDWETDEYEVDERVKRVSRGLGVDPPEILYRRCAGPLDEQAEQLATVVAEQGVALAVVDSVGMAMGGGYREGPAEESAIRLFAGFRHLGCTVLAIDHVTGDDAGLERAVHKPYGSIYKVNMARSVWELKGAVSDGSDESHLALFHRKVNRGKLAAPVGIAVTHDQDSVTFAREDVSDPGLSVALSVSARVSRLLARGAMHAIEIAEELSISDAVVRTTLARGRGRMFAKLPDGSWGLATSGEYGAPSSTRNVDSGRPSEREEI